MPARSLVFTTCGTDAAVVVIPERSGGVVSNETHQLELAFRLYTADLVIEADLVASSSEQDRLEHILPRAALEAAGLITHDGQRTPLFRELSAEALAILPRCLSLSAKLDLLHHVVQIAAADRTFRLGEGYVLLRASRLLGLTDEEFDNFLAAYPEAVGMSAALLSTGLET